MIPASQIVKGLLAGIAVALLLALLVKHASQDDAGKASAADALRADLVITMEQIGSKDQPSGVVVNAIACTRSIPATCNGELTCRREAGQVVSWAEPGCAVLDERGDELFRAPNEREACTAIYGGPETAHVKGTLNGRKIDYRLSRTNGCEIHRWEEHEGLWRKGASRANAS